MIGFASFYDRKQKKPLKEEINQPLTALRLFVNFLMKNRFIIFLLGPTPKIKRNSPSYVARISKRHNKNKAKTIHPKILR